MGLILCSKKSEAVAEYSVLTERKQLVASKYYPVRNNYAKSWNVSELY
ncbi:TPA: hypothetical protein ACS2XB_003054 [Legionella pneumophila]